MAAADPSDEHLEAIIAAVPQMQRERILAHVAELEAMGEVVTWRGGDVAEQKPDGTRVFQMPWAESCDQLDELVQLLYACGLIVAFDWGSWGQHSGYGNGRSFDDLTVSDAVRVITGFVRSDRFSEGALAASVENGLLGTAIRTAFSAGPAG